MSNILEELREAKEYILDNVEYGDDLSENVSDVCVELISQLDCVYIELDKNSLTDIYGKELKTNSEIELYEKAVHGIPVPDPIDGTDDIQIRIFSTYEQASFKLRSTRNKNLGPNQTPFIGKLNKNDYQRFLAYINEYENVNLLTLDDMITMHFDATLTEEIIPPICFLTKSSYDDAIAHREQKWFINERDFLEIFNAAVEVQNMTFEDYKMKMNFLKEIMEHLDCLYVIMQDKTGKRFSMLSNGVFPVYTKAEEAEQAASILEGIVGTLKNEQVKNAFEQFMEAGQYTYTFNTIEFDQPMRILSFECLSDQ